MHRRPCDARTVQSAYCQTDCATTASRRTAAPRMESTHRLYEARYCRRALRAGRVYNTWPHIDGALIPSAARLFFEKPWWRNLFDNTLTVQFERRMVAYALFALAILHALDAVRSRAGAIAVNGALW